MTFRYQRFRILISSALFLLATSLLFAWRDGNLSVSSVLQNGWVFVCLPPLAYFLHGGYILNKYKLDDSGLTIKRPFRTTDHIKFTDVKTLRLIKPTNYPGHDRGTLEIRYRPEGKVEVVLDRLRGGGIVRLGNQRGVPVGRGQGVGSNIFRLTSEASLA